MYIIHNWQQLIRYYKQAPTYIHACTCTKKCSMCTRPFPSMRAGFGNEINHRARVAWWWKGIIDKQISYIILWHWSWLQCTQLCILCIPISRVTIIAFWVGTVGIQRGHACVLSRNIITLSHDHVILDVLIFIQKLCTLVVLAVAYWY